MKKIYDRIVDIRGNIVTVKASGVKLKELANIYRRTGGVTLASVLSIDGKKVALQVFENPRGISTGDRVFFLGHTMRAIVSSSLLGRRLNGRGAPIDGGPDIEGTQVEVGGPSFNPVKRKMPHEMVETCIPMIDVFNCLVKSQKIPIFSTAGEPYYQLLMRIANQTSADIVMIGGMGLRYEDYQEFVENAEKSGAMEKTTMFIHQATDPVVECLLVPDMVLASAEYFATRGHNVLVLFADMTVFADAIKELMISMDQIPSNRGYPGSLYSDLASRYEKAVDIDGSGSITIISVTTMPGGDVTHPIPDNTGYITEGQFYLNEGRIDPFGSLSRLKQQVIGHVTREDHGEVANAQIRLYAESKKAQERQSMGFRLSQWDEKLLAYRSLFEEKMMDFEVNIPVGQALDLGWEILSHCFDPHETGIKQELINTYWPNDANKIHKE